MGPQRLEFIIRGALTKLTFRVVPLASIAPSSRESKRQGHRFRVLVFLLRFRRKSLRKRTIRVRRTEMSFNRDV